MWATVANQGDMAEAFNVTAYLNQTIIGTVAGISLGPGSSTIVSVDWNTAGMPPGTYVVRVYAVPVHGEDDLLDNMFNDGSVLVASSSSGCCGGGRFFPV